MSLTLVGPVLSLGISPAQLNGEGLISQRDLIPLAQLSAAARVDLAVHPHLPILDQEFRLSARHDQAL